MLWLDAELFGIQSFMMGTVDTGREDDKQLAVLADFSGRGLIFTISVLQTLGWS